MDDSQATSPLQPIVRPRGSSASAPAPVPIDPHDATVISTQPPISPEMIRGSAAVQEMSQTLVGQRLGQFELEDFIGGGGMGAVFKARDTSLNRVVAVKVLSPRQAGDEELLRRFQNEAQSAARLDHENIARVYFVGEDRGVHFIVFEYVDGINLRDLVIEGGPITIEDAVRFAVQISEALSHASLRDVIHRDIKPSNVIITPEAKAKVVDMGLARLHQVEHSQNDLTASGMTLGTFDYISPEQARDPRSADVRSDLYSLGCTLYFALSGQPPFPEGTAVQKLLKHQTDEPADLRTLRSDIPAEFARVIRKLLAKEPERRPQSPGELIADLSKFAQHLGLSLAVSAGSVGSLTPRPARALPAWWRHLPWLLPGSLLVIVVALMQWFQMWQVTDGGAESIPPPDKLSRPATSSGSINSTSSRSSVNAVPSAVGSSPSAPPSSGEMERLIHALVELGKNQLTTLPQQPTSNPLPAAETGRVLRVGEGDDLGPASFRSLTDALRQIQSGDTIELCWNETRPQPPILLANKDLTIRAGRGFQPGLRLQPLAADTSSQVLFALQASKLDVAGVQLEAAHTRNTGGNVALIEASRGSRLRLKDCWMTVEEAARASTLEMQRSSLIAIREPAAANVETSPAVISLENCFCRGEGDFLLVADGCALQFDWHQGLLATRERFLNATTTSTLAPLAVRMRHVSICMGQGLALIKRYAPSGRIPPVRFDIANSILRVADPSASLIEQKVRDARGETWNEAIRWTGDQNLYDNVRSYLRMTDAVGSTNGASDDDYDWPNLTHELYSQHNVAPWLRLPSVDHPYHLHLPADYALAPSAVSRLAALVDGSGKAVGCDWNALPGGGTSRSTLRGGNASPPGGRGSAEPRPAATSERGTTTDFPQLLER